MTTRRLLSAAAVVLAVAAVDSDATFAQTVVSEDGWQAWLGCWRADGAPASEILCVAPERAGARMLTVVDGAVRAEWPVLTDGRARNIQRDDCTGTELAHWSVDGQRVFLNSDLSCEGGVKRQVSGIFALTSPANWLSVQSITIGDNTATRTVRYTAIDQAMLPGALQGLVRGNRLDQLAARESALTPIDENDVTEAANSVADAAVREWLSAIDAPFQLDPNEPSDDINAPAYDAVSSQWSPYSYNTPGVVVVDPRPVTKTVYVTNNIYRSCWDPFYSGLVVGYHHGFGVGVTSGYANCGRGYYSRYYSPWGYDLFGWRMFYRPFVVVRGGPTIIRRTINIHRGPNIRRDRDWDDNNDWQRGRATRSGYTNGNTSDRTRSTPERTSTQPDRSRASTNGNSGSWTNRSRGESSGNTSRTQRTSSGTNSGSSTRTRVSSGSSSNSNSGSSRATSGGYQSSSGSRGTAKARTNQH